jgi:two-component system OmpR family response regulator
MRVLLVEDDGRLAWQIATALTHAGYTVDQTGNGEDGWFMGDSEPYDAVILDLGLPVLDGITALRRWRSAGRAMPVLILTARASWREKVMGLREGADDYLAKPFEIEELLARLEALIRRAAGHASPTISLAGLDLDPASQRVSLAGVPLDLTPLEYRALAYLMLHSDKVISKTELTEHIYGQDDDRDSNVIEVLINRLRKKIGADLIRTHRGHGYEIGEPRP